MEGAGVSDQTSPAVQPASQDVAATAKARRYSTASQQHVGMDLAAGVAGGYLDLSRRMAQSQPGEQKPEDSDDEPEPEPERKYGIIVFGATGVAGKRIMVELACNAKGVKWAACGRSKVAVQQALVDAGLSGIDVLVADAKDPASMERHFVHAQVVINCTGPYRFLGLPVVQTCIATRTHYVDVTGETEFIMQSELQFFERAKDAEVLVVHCCGFDSVPADEGVLFTTEQLGCTSFVESFMAVHAGDKGFKINTTTFEAALHGVQEVQRTRETRKKLASARVACGRDYQGPRLKVKDAYWDERIQGTAIKFPGADATVVKTSAIYRSARTHESEVQYAAYFNAGSQWNALRFGFHDQLVKLTSSLAGIETAVEYAELLTAGLVKKGGPEDDMMAEAAFDVTFYGMGWKDKLQDPKAQYEGFPTWQAVTRVSGPEPGYVTTAICATSAALTLILDKIVLPYKGGVLMPSEAFAGTRFRKRLMARGIKFEVVSSRRHIYSVEEAENATHWERELDPKIMYHWGYAKDQAAADDKPQRERYVPDPAKRGQQVQF